MRLRRVTLREYVAGLDSATGERLQTREFVAQSEVTIRKLDDAVWVSGARRTIVVPWSAVLQCEPEAATDDRPIALGRKDEPTPGIDAWLPADTDAEQLRAYGCAMAEAVLPQVPPSDAAQVAAYGCVQDYGAVSPITQALEDAGVIERLPPSDAFEALSDAVGAPMRRVNSEVDAEAQNVNKGVDSEPPPEPVPQPRLTRKERRRSRR